MLFLLIVDLLTLLAQLFGPLAIELARLRRCKRQSATPVVPLSAWPAQRDWPALRDWRDWRRKEPVAREPRVIDLRPLTATITPKRFIDAIVKTTIVEPCRATNASALPGSDLVYKTRHTTTHKKVKKPIHMVVVMCVFPYLSESHQVWLYMSCRASTPVLHILQPHELAGFKKLLIIARTDEKRRELQAAKAKASRYAVRK
jgi:hypothetical protein